ncbi:hypothetical protein, conserved [Trypanosoma brucei gambiense DAL972]|uniref:Eukaryotic membrane protein n=3 Tax=Trypanozoon TaxID=39700 RepID=C9ZUV5_TRYB9|nr:hypothetical protein, conserved [Trypanosoma brucei gambiense DAL972]CBH13193.1 hypothetical protein, conserved [Trypanosoma brucei gambiense DAL972]|eukprot:XP_011775470.1 hypothetical protein, conserved [Trypanosoma brucei gambiense DAL972]
MALLFHPPCRILYVCCRTTFFGSSVYTWLRLERDCSLLPTGFELHSRHMNAQGKVCVIVHGGRCYVSLLLESIPFDCITPILADIQVCVLKATCMTVLSLFYSFSLFLRPTLFSQSIRGSRQPVLVTCQMQARLLRSLFGPSDRERCPDASRHEGSTMCGQQDIGFVKQLRHFVRMPDMFVDIEYFFALTILGMVENLLSLLILPLKLIVSVHRFERRDAVALVLIVVGVLTYTLLSFKTVELYAYLYHAVRRTSFIKLMMVFNILEVADKLLSALSHEATEVLTACVGDWRGAAQTCGEQCERFAATWLPVLSAVVAVVSVAAHAVVLLLSVVTLNVAVNSEGNLLLTLIVSSSLSELKGAVYKKHNRESLYSVAAADAIERVKFLLFVLVMVMQHMHERFCGLDFADTLFVLLSEVAVDFTKHLFVAKFNGISLSVYRSFTQLTLIDMAAETVLWRLTHIRACCVDSALYDSQDLRKLLRPSDGFFPKYVRRTGFVPVPYAALLLWSFSPIAHALFRNAPLLLLLVLVAVMLLKVFMSELIHSVSMRFVVRSMLSAESCAGECQYSKWQNTVGSQLHGVSPLATPPRVRKQRGEEPMHGTAKVLQLTSFLCSLMTLDPFDLQVGKLRR